MRRDIIRSDLYIDDTNYDELCRQINRHKNFFLSIGCEKGDTIFLNLPPNTGVEWISSYMACLELGLPMLIWDDFLWDITNEEYIHGGAEGFVEKSDRIILNTREYTQRFKKNRHFIQYTISDRDINYKRFPYWKQMIDSLEEVTSLHEYKLDGMSERDVQPWEVNEDDVALILNSDLNSDEPKFTEVTYRELTLDFPKDEVFGFSMSLHHKDILQNGILPALTNSKRLVYLLIPSPSLYGRVAERAIKKTIEKIEQYGVTAMYCDGEDSMSSLFRLMGERDFDKTLRVIVNGKRTDFHDYWEAEKNIFFDFSA